MANKYAVITDFGTDTEILFSSNSKDEIVEWLKAQNDVRGFMVVNTGAPIGDRTKTVEDFLRQNIIPEIFSQLVPKYYTMDPETEDMLPDGTHLANGLRVLIADPDQRERPEKLGVNELGVTQDWLRQRLLDRNRWCTVSHFKFTNNGQTVSFVAVYEDGTKSKYNIGASYAWLVKTDSVHEVGKIDGENYRKVVKIVKGVVDEVACTEVDNATLKDIAHKTAVEILGTIG